MAQNRRLRRLRSSENIRRLVADARLDPSRFVLPIFVGDKETEARALPSLPGHFVRPVSEVKKIAKEAESAGLPGLLIFGVTDEKDELGSRADAPDGPIQRAISEVKNAGDLVVFVDTCLCGYTSHGHCGIVDEMGRVINDVSVERLTEVAVSQAAAGADFISPSDMMDGRVRAIREALDQSGRTDTGIMSYSAKFSSSMYGPFREAAGCAPTSGDRKGYQIDRTSKRQALASMKRDVEEGADIVMVKPALAYLDIIEAARHAFDVPISSFNVSGEFAMIKAAAEKGWIDEQEAMLEVLTSLVRAGSDFVITYHALEAVRRLEDQKH